MPWKTVPRCSKCGSKPNYVMSYAAGRYWNMTCAKPSCRHEWKVLQKRYQKKGKGR